MPVLVSQPPRVPTSGFLVPEAWLVSGGVPLVDSLLEELTRRDVAFLLANPRAPWLYGSGTRYQSSADRTEWWSTVPEILRTRRTDCQDLAPWRAAELQARGVDSAARAFCRLHRMPGGDMLFHALVRRGSGAVEDPSALLGMPR